MRDIKKYAVIAVFALVIFGMAITQLILPDQTLSNSERRKLTQAPAFSLEDVFSGKYSGKLEDYLLDQFPMRDGFRTLKAIVNTRVFSAKDNNGYYIEDGAIYKLEYPLKDKQVKLAAGKISAIIADHPEIEKAYYSIIPDKNYFTAKQNGYPSMDYDALVKLMNDNVTAAEYIDIFDSLKIDDYYRSDTHWRQDKIMPVVKKLCIAMGVPFADISEYEENTLSPFYGVFAGQSALPSKPDDIVYLTNADTQNAQVQSIEQDKPMPVYILEDFEGMDGYDIFLSGAEAVITIENPDARTDKELIIFRDSFGSSITPLLISSYSKITMIDLRYISSMLIDEYANFEGADVLFLYSTLLLNSGGLLK